MKTMKATTCPKRSTEQGTALLELALLLPLLVVMVLGVIDLGRLIHARLVVTNVSREGGSLASRDRGGTDQNLLAMLQTSATPFDLANQGRIYITKIGAGNLLNNPPHPNPYIISQAQGGALSVSSSIIGSSTSLQSGLSQVITNYLSTDPQTGLPDISGVTVVEVFYHYRPITPLPGFVQNLFPNNGGINIGSRSVFQTGVR
jgi:hypothetical protein